MFEIILSYVVTIWYYTRTNPLRNRLFKAMIASRTRNGVLAYSNLLVLGEQFVKGLTPVLLMF